MAIDREKVIRKDIMDIDIANGNVSRSFAHKMISEGDRNAVRFGVRVLRNGQEVNLAGGACTGYFIRPDEITLVIGGTVDRSVAWVELPEAAFAREGVFQLTIKVSGDDVLDAVRIVDGTIVRSTTEDIRDPSSQMPSLEDYDEAIAAAEAATAAIEALTVEASQISGTRYRIEVTKEE